MVEFSLFPTAYWAKLNGERSALVWEKGDTTLFPDVPKQLSWATLHQLILQCGDWLCQKRGMDFHDKTIAYVGESRFAALLCYLAVIALGGRIVILNPALPPLQQQAVLDEISVDCVLDETDFTDFSRNLPACSLPTFQAAQPATLTLTSGSSGKPKAVVHTVSQHLINAAGVCHLLNFTRNDRWLLSLPLFHVSGQGIIWRWLQQGANLVICDDKSQFYQQLAQCSHASLVPTQLQRYLQQQQPTRPQHILLGGTHLPATLMQQAQTHNIITYAGYGMTEMASTVCAVALELDNVGKPLLQREVKLVSEEIYLRGGCLALGYWQHGEIIPLPTQHGWFATKDKGVWNEKGQLCVRGRLDNMFISGGENIQPEEIEQCLYRSNLVKQIIVLPIEDAEFGHRPVAFVEFIGEYHEQAVELLQNFAKTVLEKFKLPIAYYSLEGMLEQSGIKISRKQLQQHLNHLLNKEQVQ